MTNTTSAWDGENAFLIQVLQAVFDVLHVCRRRPVFQSGLIIIPELVYFEGDDGVVHAEIWFEQL